MPYLNNRSLPAEVKGVLPPAGQQIWRTTFNAQQAQDGIDDAHAKAAAWAELKQRGWTVDSAGNWNPPRQKAGLAFAVVKQDTPQRYTLGVVYVPDELDTQDDYATAATIEAAAWQFMRSLQQGQVTKSALALWEAMVTGADGDAVDATSFFDTMAKAQYALGDQHSMWDESLGHIVESYLLPCACEIAGEPLPQGTWMLGVVWSPASFAKIQAGERTGLSMGGTGKRRPAALAKEAPTSPTPSTLVDDLIHVLQAYSPPAVHVHMPPVAMQVHTPVDVHVPEATMHTTVHVPPPAVHVTHTERTARPMTKEVIRDPVTQLITKVVEHDDAEESTTEDTPPRKDT